MAIGSRSESSIERSCVTYALKQKVRSIKLSHAESGLPDRIFLLLDGRCWLVEFKTETGRIRPRQKLVFGALTPLGHPVTVIRTTADFKVELKKRLQM